MISRRQAIASGAVVVLLGIILARSTGSLAFWNYAPRKTPDPQTQDTPDKALLKKPDEGPALTKRSVRDMGRKPTKEETITLFQTTIVPQFDVEDATYQETVANLNQLARDSGIPERELTFSIDPSVAKDPAFAHYRIRELRIRNASLPVVAKYICGSSKIKCRISPGKVTFGLVDDFEEEPAPVAQEEIEPDDGAEKVPIDPDDPFSQVGSGEADPFADPVPSIKSK